MTYPLKPPYASDTRPHPICATLRPHLDQCNPAVSHVVIRGIAHVVRYGLVRVEADDEQPYLILNASGIATQSQGESLGTLGSIITKCAKCQRTDFKFDGITNLSSAFAVAIRRCNGFRKSDCSQIRVWRSHAAGIKQSGTRAHFAPDRIVTVLKDGVTKGALDRALDRGEMEMNLPDSFEPHQAYVSFILKVGD